MSQYRDEREALRARVESLEDELRSSRAEVDKLQAEGPAEERIERLTAELEAAEQELARLRGDAPARVPLLFGGATGSIGVAVLATMWLLGAGLGSPCAQHFTDGSDLPTTYATDSTRARICPRIAATGIVTDVSGAVDVERDASCELATLPVDGQCKVKIRCDHAWLYDGFAHLRGDGRIVDERSSASDLDPRLDIDPRSGRAEISDDVEDGSYSIEIDFSEDI